MGRRLRPGDWIALGLVAEALAIDLVLIGRKHDTISSCIRTSLPLKAMAFGIGLHLWRSWRWDPLGNGGQWLEAQLIRWETQREVRALGVSR